MVQVALVGLVDFAMTKDIDSNSNRDNSNMDIDSNRDIGIGTEDILGMSDIPDTMSCLLAVL
jgi:hypothetical protein